MILSRIVVEPVERLRAAVARALARLGITPHALTLIGLLLTVGAGALFALGHFRWAAATIVLASAFDLLDGSVARITGKTSRFGAFLDSTLDRYSDTAIFIGLIVHYVRAPSTPAVLSAALAMVGSLLVSYTRARAECFIDSCKVGFFERPERLVAVILGAFAGSMPAALWVLAILTHWTVIVRIHHTWRTLRGRPTPPANTFTGKLYHIIFWDFNRGSIQYDVVVVILSACIIWLPV